LNSKILLYYENRNIAKPDNIAPTKPYLTSGDRWLPTIKQ